MTLKKKKYIVKINCELELINGIQLSVNLLAQETVLGNSSLCVGLPWFSGRQGSLTLAQHLLLLRVSHTDILNGSSKQRQNTLKFLVWSQGMDL